MNPDRNSLRRELRQRRREIPAGRRIAAAESLAAQLLALPCMPTSGFIAGYWAMDGEIALHVFQLRLPPALTYCLPVLDGDRLRFSPWRPGDALATNRYGIPEPDLTTSPALDAQAMSMVVLPLVGFDANGHRLGMGGGWYDRSFAFRNHSSAPPWLVGAAFATQQLDAVVAEAWDVAVDAICTERETLLINGVPA